MSEPAAALSPPTAQERTSASGLSAAEVTERTRRGLVNTQPARASRTIGQIVRANVVTRFNLLLTALLVVILLVAPPQDGLFGLVMVVNAAIGIVQEVRAKRALDRLALLTAPRARVVRDGQVTEVPVDGVVRDDLLVCGPGDQLVVDAAVVDTQGLEVDESLLTGEADPVVKAVGEECLSGSFVVAGTGRLRATQVGAEAFAARLSAEARVFSLVSSELMGGIDWLLRAISWLLVPTIPLLVVSQWSAAAGWRSAVAGAVAGSVAMIPQGLVLLTSVAFAVGGLRLAAREVLVRELPAVEVLARVDVLCFDKTGTLTEGRLVVREVQPLTPADLDTRAVLGALAAADPAPNATLRAIADASPAPDGWEATEHRPFSSERAYSGARFGDRGTFVLGAPDALAPGDADLRRRADAETDAGHRVLLLATTEGTLAPEPGEVTPLALVVLGDVVRDDVASTLAWFDAQGVAAKVISGDHPRTVAAIAAQAGLPGADKVVDGHDLPDAPGALADTVEANTVFGRVTPQQKRSMVAALQSRGHVVAMTGDGVNDVLALKDADLGIAMGNGADATRSVAQLVLLDSRFEQLPTVVAEGRRVTANIERVANLFVTKTVYAFLLAVAVGVWGLVFPFLPRHLTLVGSVTIGIPAFFLALEPTTRRYRRGFIGRVLRFALPVGTVAAAATFSAYWLATQEGTSLVDSRTVATIVLGSIGTFALILVCRPPTRLRRAVVGGVVVAFALAFIIPPATLFFALAFPRPVVLLAAIGIVALTGTALTAALRAVGWVQSMSIADVEELAGEAISTTRRAVAEAARTLRHHHD